MVKKKKKKKKPNKHEVGAWQKEEESENILKVSLCGA